MAAGSNNLPHPSDPAVHYALVGVAPPQNGGSAAHPRPDEPHLPHLPNEIIFNIVRFLSPTNRKGLMAPEDPRTQTLLSVSRTCKALYLVASQAIRAHCVFLDSHDRLSRFYDSVKNHSPPAFVKEGDYPDVVKRGLRGTVNIFLRPFPLDPHPYPDAQSHGTQINTMQRNLTLYDETTGLPPVSRNIPLENSLARMLHTNALLAVNTLGLILSECSGSLDRIIIDLPLRYIAPPREHTEVYHELVRVLLRMRKISEFIILQDERYFRAFPQWPVSESPPNWAHVWPALRPLMFYNPLPDRHADIWTDMVHVKHNELVIFMNYGGIMRDGLQSKLIWLEHANTAAEPHIGQNGQPMPPEHACMRHRNLTVVSTDAHRDPNFYKCPLNWDFVGSTGRVRSLSARKVLFHPDDNGVRPQVNYFRHFPWQVWNESYIFPLTDAAVPGTMTEPGSQNAFVRWSIWFFEMRRLMRLANELQAAH